MILSFCVTCRLDVEEGYCVAVCCSVLQCVAVCYSVLQCVAVCCSVLQCVDLDVEEGYSLPLQLIPQTNDGVSEISPLELIPQTILGSLDMEEGYFILICLSYSSISHTHLSLIPICLSYPSVSLTHLSLILIPDDK